MNNIANKYKSVFRDIFSYRSYIVSSVKFEIYSKYKRSKLGLAWLFIQPFIQVLIYALVMSTILKAKIPGIDNINAYPIYIISGIIGWIFFQDTLTRIVNVFTENTSLITKTLFPRIILPVMVLSLGLFNFFILMLITLLIFFFLGHYPYEYIFWIFILSFVLILLIFSIGLLMGLINVFFRDISQVVSLFLQLFFWFTPIVYSIDMVPDSFRSYFLLNPLYGVLSGFQNVLAFNNKPDLDLLIYPFLFGVTFLIIGIKAYKKISPHLGDYL